jgi:hypothetical protein
MAYRDFTFDKIESLFQIKQVGKKLFSNIKQIAPSQLLIDNLATNTDLLTTEKALSEAIVFPVLKEIRLKNSPIFRLFSGENLIVDRKLGLNGECDFLISKSPESVTLKAPIISVTEAKNGVIDSEKSLAQTTAQMIGARLFNQKKNSYQIIHGACTNGYDWLFLKLEEDTIFIDTDRYSVQNLPQLLGALQSMLDFYTTDE